MASVDYANARIRGMKARLLGREGIQALLAQADLGARLDLLRRTDYGELLAAQVLTTADLLEAAERALRARLRADFHALDRFLSGERARALLRVILAFEDGCNVKTIVRGLARAEPPERLLPLLLPTPGLDEPALAALAAERDVRGLVARLATWASPYAVPLADALPEYLRRGDPAALESAFDRFLFAEALAEAARHGAVGEPVRRFLETWIDLINAATLLRGPRDAAGVDVFVPGGRLLEAPLFGRLATLQESDLHATLERTFRSYLGGAGIAPETLADPFETDQLFHAALRRAVTRQARIEPLSLAVPLAFILERQAEIRRIRLVLRGTALGVAPEQLLRLVEP